MKYFTDVDERGITTNSAAVLATFMAINLCPCGGVESAATRHDVEAAVSMDDRQLFAFEVIDKNFEEEYMEKINESTDKCHEPENHDKFARECRCSTRGPQQGWCYCGLRAIRGATDTFGHKEREIVFMVHGRDVASTADIEDLCWLESMHEIATDIIGHDGERARSKSRC